SNHRNDQVPVRNDYGQPLDRGWETAGTPLAHGLDGWPIDVADLAGFDANGDHRSWVPALATLNGTPVARRRYIGVTRTNLGLQVPRTLPVPVSEDHQLSS